MQIMLEVLTKIIDNNQDKIQYVNITYLSNGFERKIDLLFQIYSIMLINR